MEQQATYVRYSVGYRLTTGYHLPALPAKHISYKSPDRWGTDRLPAIILHRISFGRSRKNCPALEAARPLISEIVEHVLTK